MGAGLFVVATFCLVVIESTLSAIRIVLHRAASPPATDLNAMETSSMTNGTPEDTDRSWVDEELQDSFDEELEMEIDDERIRRELQQVADLGHKSTLDRRFYFRELLRLQAELVKLQDWIVHTGYRLVVIFEGRDAASKGGVIKRITQRLNPRVCRTVALPTPTEREKRRWYFQRYVPHLPADGEIVLFDRSWYNRAGVERVMDFATPVEVEQFFGDVSEFERMLERSGVKLIKYRFSITDQEQQLPWPDCLTSAPMGQFRLN